MNTINDIRARMAAGMLNEDFQSALDRIIAKRDEIEAMDRDQKDLIGDRLQATADYIDNFGPISKIKEYFTVVKGYSDDDWSRIQKQLEREGEQALGAFIDYIKKPVTVDYFTKMTTATDVPKAMAKDFNLPYSTIADIFKMDGAMKSGKGVGRGELFLGFMIDGATNASVGDVNINGDPYEVKAKSARLNTQNGFGTGNQAMINFFKEFAKYSAFHWGNFKLNKPTKELVQSFNFTEVKGRKQGSKFYELFQACVEDGLDLNKLFELIADTLFCSRAGIWMNANSSIRNGVVKAFKDNVNPDGTPKDNIMLNYALMWQNILYYQSQEYFNGIFLINPSTNKLAYLPVDPSKDMTLWLSQNVKYSQPSWQDKPTSDSWKITLK